MNLKMSDTKSMNSRKMFFSKLIHLLILFLTLKKITENIIRTAEGFAILWTEDKYLQLKNKYKAKINMIKKMTI